MIIYTDLAYIELAARTVGVELGSGTPEKKGNGYRVRLKLGEDKDRYRRLSHDLTRKVAAVCWHGHRDFFRAIYVWDPQAKIRTAVAKYENAEHFEDTFHATGLQNIGYAFQPCQLREACNCVETGLATGNASEYRKR